ncbi:MAG: fumarylacetoacetate hydrolase family protein [Planctomycetota bacterium]
MTPRLFATSAGLVLEHEARYVDWSARMRHEGVEGDLLSHVRAGVFERQRFGELWSSGPWIDVAPPVQVDVPIPRPGKILALGKNFAAHAAEFGERVPAEPLVFEKLPECLVPSGATVSPPPGYDRRFDHEAELAVWIGGEGRAVAPERALELVAGYTVANDLTLRSLQGSDRKQGRPWFFAKNFDGALPLGPCFVPRDQLDVSELTVTCSVNGELRQAASTRQFVVSIEQAIAHISRHLTLHAGDLVLMGTPAGVGPLEDGDVVVAAVEGIGDLVTTIARPRG